MGDRWGRSSWRSSSGWSSAPRAGPTPAPAIYILVAYPFGEWAIHVHLLHLRPFDFRGRRIELATARAHRAHHEDPRSLDLINFSPVEALAVLLLAVPAAAGLGDGVLAHPRRADWRPGRWATMLVTGFLMVGVYEWTHSLIHTGLPPPGSPAAGRSGTTTASITITTSTTGTGSPTRSQTRASTFAQRARHGRPLPDGKDPPPPPLFFFFFFFFFFSSVVCPPASQAARGLARKGRRDP